MALGFKREGGGGFNICSRGVLFSLLFFSSGFAMVCLGFWFDLMIHCTTYGVLTSVMKPSSRELGVSIWMDISSPS